MQRNCAKQTKPQNSSKTGPPPKIAYTMLLRETETLTENDLRLMGVDESRIVKLAKFSVGQAID